MKFSRLFSCSSLASALWIFLAFATVAGGAATNQVAGKATGSKTSAVTNAGPVELTIPTAVFELAVKPTKDPFFPLSMRQPVPIISTNIAPAFSISSFTLKGLSGSSNMRLALINNRTVAAGENAEITTINGKIKIRCVEIKENSVVIRADAQPDSLEIFLRKSAQ